MNQSQEDVKVLQISIDTDLVALALELLAHVRYRSVRLVAYLRPLAETSGQWVLNRTGIVGDRIR